MRSILPIVSLLASATSVVGHSTFQDLWVGTEDEAETCGRQPPSNNPVIGVDNTDIRCNVGGEKGISGVCTAAGMS
jgi:cellulase